MSRLPAPRPGRELAEDYQALALETLDSLLAGPLAGGLSSGQLQAHFPLIRAALRQIRSDLDRARSDAGEWSL